MRPAAARPARAGRASGESPARPRRAAARASISSRAKMSASWRSAPEHDDPLAARPAAGAASSPSIGITAATPVPVAAKTMSPACTGSSTKKPCGPVMFDRSAERQRHQVVGGLAFGNHADDEAEHVAGVALRRDRIAAPRESPAAARRRLPRRQRQRHELAGPKHQPLRRPHGEGQLGDAGRDHVARAARR